MLEIADVFHVSDRTVRSDIKNLKKKYPLITERGSNGGVRLPASFKLIECLFTRREIEALLKAIFILEGFNLSIVTILKGMINSYAFHGWFT